jgi:hypothetical protein
VMAPIQRSGGEAVTTLLSPDFHLPLFCSVFTLWIGLLSNVTNNKYIERNPKCRLRSKVAILTFVSSGCIVLMYCFAINRALFGLWLASYGLLCWANAAWNYWALSQKERPIHVLTNALLGFILLAFALFGRNLLQRATTVYLILIVVLAWKGWQRFFHPRFV